MTATQKLIAALAAGVALGSSVIAALLGGFGEEQCPKQQIKPLALVSRAFDTTGLVELGDTVFTMTVDSVTYFRYPTPKHLHRWPLIDGGDARDAIDVFNGTNGELSPGVTWGEEDGRTFAVFDSVGDVIHLWPFEYIASSPDTTPFNIFVWIRISSWGIGGDGRIISKATSSANDDHWLMLSPVRQGGFDGYARMRIKTSQGTRVVISDEPVLQLTQWHCVQGQYDGSNITLWVDGNRVAKEPWSGNVVNDMTIPTAIGNQPHGGKQFYGDISDVRIW